MKTLLILGCVALFSCTSPRIQGINYDIPVKDTTIGECTYVIFTSKSKVRYLYVPYKGKNVRIYLLGGTRWQMSPNFYNTF